jgi:twitching motility protein PilT
MMRHGAGASEDLMDIDRLLQLAIDHGASDLHLSGGNPPMLRIDGEIRPLEAPPLAGAAIAGLLQAVLDEPQRAAYTVDLEIDVAVAHASGTRFRLNAFTNRAGAAAVFRTIPSAVPTLEQLGAPWVLERIAGLAKGLVLVTGPTGSGKSTTLAALIDHINRADSRHILTIEDPIEFVHPSKRSLINQREVGRDTHSFARALRSALRADPDVILVGELRDYETIALALTAAETGHLVLATLHTTSAAKTIDRLIDVVPSADKAMVRTMLSSSLQAVIAQILLKRADGRGRIAAYEVLVGTAAVANLIRENQVAQIASMIQTGSRFGMQLMSDAVHALAAAHRIDPVEAERVLLALGDAPEAAELAPSGAATTAAGRPQRGAGSLPGYGF